MGRRQLFRSIAIACLALLAALLLRLDWSQVALSWNRPTFNILTNRLTSAEYMPANEFGEEQKLVAANSKDALDEAKKQFICFKSSKEYPISKFRKFSHNKIKTEIVSHLAKELSDCIRQNRRNIDFVDLKNLYRVIYTTKLLQNNNKAIVIVGVGSPSKIPERARFSEGIVDFLAEKSNKSDFSIALENTNISNKSFPLLYKVADLNEIDLGKFIIRADGNINLPDKLRLSGNEASINASLKISHELIPTQAPFTFFELNFLGKASDFDKDFISGKKTELARVELTFNGLFLKGIPYYLENRQKELQNDLGVKINPDKRDDSKASLIKTVGLSNIKAFEELQVIENGLTSKQRQVRDLQAKIKNNPTNSQHPKNLQTAENELKNLLADKVKRLEPLHKVQFQCAPSFKRIIDFPIWGKSSSTGSGSTGASAGVGVRGDVVIDIANPTCDFSIVPPYNSTSTTYADVSITSHGYFGARAQAQASGDIGIKFQDKYDKDKGEYVLDLNKVSNPSEQEKNYARAVLEKTLEKAKKDGKMIQQLGDDIDRVFVQPLLSSEGLRNELTNIENRLIDEYSRNRKKLCSDMKERVGDAALVCWALLPESEAINIARTQGVGFLSKIPSPPEKTFAEKVCELSGVKLALATGGLSETKKGREQINKFCGWLNNKRNLEKTINDTYKSYADPFKSADVVQKLARSFVKNSLQLPQKVLNSKDLEPMARKLLDSAFEVNKTVRDANEFVEIFSNPTQLDILMDLNLKIKSSANAEFDSKAYILQARPTFQLESTLVFPDGKPTLHLKGSSYQNGPGSNKGQIGGLEPLNLVLKARLVAFLGSKNIFSVPPQGRQELPLIESPIIEVGTPKLSNTKDVLYDEKISLSFRNN